MKKELKLTDIVYIVNQLGGHVTQNGYSYLSTTIWITLKRRVYSYGILTKKLYPETALAHSCTPDRVSRSIARSVLDFWNYGDRELFTQLTGKRLTEKPTPGEMIYLLASYFAGEPLPSK